MITKELLKQAEETFIELGPRGGYSPEEVLSELGIDTDGLREFEAETDHDGVSIFIAVYATFLSQGQDPLADLKAKVAA